MLILLGATRAKGGDCAGRCQMLIRRRIGVGRACMPFEGTRLTRPVRIVVTLPPASTPDLGARVVAEMLGKIWGQQVVVENKPGGGGAIGIQSVLSSPRDGYTLLYTVSSAFTVLPVQQKGRLAFDVATDLTPIGLI